MDVVVRDFDVIKEIGVPNPTLALSYLRTYWAVRRLRRDELRVPLSRFLLKQARAKEQRNAELNFDMHGRIGRYIQGGKNDDRSPLENLVLRDKVTDIIETQLQCGEILFGLASSENYSKILLGQAWDLSRTAVSLKQFKVYRGVDGRPTGVLVWLWISDATAERVSFDANARIHPSEWNEGSSLWFRNLAASSLSAEEIAADLSGGLFPTAPMCRISTYSGKLDRSVATSVAGEARGALREWLVNQFNQNQAT
ncbi:toxin-activating lysine-acyltransferase [Paucibacter sp. KCTC 42545]|uniref:toxin-activating lysine-acyltransferase n=1 Tax=Paucibacter sp. KCTC 42545 TaxID=1768242 RepID=UPI0009E76F9D|nr:toxin-activating lysine-acyltransferase [Paucibacter sp. KCTC 42545]